MKELRNEKKESSVTNHSSMHGDSQQSENGTSSFIILSKIIRVNEPIINLSCAIKGAKREVRKRANERCKRADERVAH